MLSTLTFSQPMDSIITTKSESVNLAYAPSRQVQKATIEFFKTSQAEYGIKLFFLAPELPMAHIAAINMDTLCMYLSKNQKLSLTKKYCDTLENFGGVVSWTLYFRINETELKLLRTEHLIFILSKAGNNPIQLRLAKRSRDKISQIANSF